MDEAAKFGCATIPYGTPGNLFEKRRPGGRRGWNRRRGGSGCSTAGRRRNLVKAKPERLSGRPGEGGARRGATAHAHPAGGRRRARRGEERRLPSPTRPPTSPAAAA